MKITQVAEVIEDQLESQIERLRRLRDSGALSAEEYLAAVENLAIAAVDPIQPTLGTTSNSVSEDSTTGARDADLQSSQPDLHEGGPDPRTGLPQSTPRESPISEQVAVDAALSLGRSTRNSRSTVFRVWAVLVLIAVAFAAGWLLQSQPDNEATSPAIAPNSSVLPATERPAVSETEPTQGHTAEALTFTTDGSTPVAFPDCLGLLGFCLGQPGEAITADYGLDSERYSSGDSLYRTWRTPAGDLVAETDEVDSIVALQVRLTETSPNARIAIADGLVLGEMTFGDVLDTYPNAYAELFFAEGAAFFSLTEVGGPEGSVSTRLSTAIDGGSPAGGGDAYRKLLESSDTEQVTPVVLDIFRDLLVTSVRVQYG